MYIWTHYFLPISSDELILHDLSYCIKCSSGSGVSFLSILYYIPLVFSFLLLTPPTPNYTFLCFSRLIFTVPTLILVSTIALRDSGSFNWPTALKIKI